ncbi:MAG TPA: hypothetical protein VHA52_00600, partial [Candidatus Babeliaceae bacterium]|nr:hypothetical protein [Candidatus Babeliaceae bacterium]
MKKIFLTIILLGSGLVQAAGLSNFTQIGKVQGDPGVVMPDLTLFISNDNPKMGIIVQEVQ